MTLAYSGTIDVGSSTLVGAVESSGFVLTISTTTLKKWDLETGTQSGSDLVMSGTARGICVVGASAVVSKSTSSNWSLVDIGTLYETNFSGGSASITNNGARSMASDRDSGVAFFGTTSSRNIGRFSGGSVTNISLDVGSNIVASSFLHKTGTTNFFMACTGGWIYEIDSSGNIVQERQISLDPSNYLHALASTPTLTVRSMAYIDGFLYIWGSIPQMLWVLDWTTGNLVHMSSNLSTNMVVSDPASGMFLMGRDETQQTNTASAIYEVSPYIYGWGSVSPELDNSILYISSPGAYVSIGCNAASGIGWALQETIDDLRIFSVTASSSLVETTHSSPNNEDFRLIVVDETGGQGNLKVIVDTYTTSPRTLHLPGGKDILEIIKIGEGVDAQWDVSRYST